MARLRRVLYTVPIGILLITTVFPYAWVLMASFKVHEDLFSRPIRWLFSPTVENYLEILDKGFGFYFLNSVIVGFCSTALCLTIGTLAAYALSRYRVPAGEHLFFYILATRLGPPIAYALPMYLIFDRIGIANSLIGVILAHATFNLVLVVWMMKSFFDDVPREVEEAAFLDGAGSVSRVLSNRVADDIHGTGGGYHFRPDILLERASVRVGPHGRRGPHVHGDDPVSGGAPQGSLAPGRGRLHLPERAGACPDFLCATLPGSRPHLRRSEGLRSVPSRGRAPAACHPCSTRSRPGATPMKQSFSNQRNAGRRFGLADTLGGCGRQG